MQPEPTAIRAPSKESAKTDAGPSRANEDLEELCHFFTWPEAMDSGKREFAGFPVPYTCAFPPEYFPFLSFLSRLFPLFCYRLINDHSKDIKN